MKYIPINETSIGVLEDDKVRSIINVNDHPCKQDWASQISFRDKLCALMNEQLQDELGGEL